jgi:hypothetical protein
LQFQFGPTQTQILHPSRGFNRIEFLPTGPKPAPKFELGPRFQTQSLYWDCSLSLCQKPVQASYSDMSAAEVKTQPPPTSQVVRDGQRWKHDEDTSLSRAYVANSINAVKGTDQESCTLWRSIHQSFVNILVKEHDVTSERSVQALKNRWSSINRDVAKFAGCYHKVEELDESGKTLEDRISDAMEMFKQQTNHAFQYLECWNILKHHPKWASSPQVENRKRKDNGSSETSSSEATEENQRPIGNKRAKQLVANEIQESRRLEMQIKASQDVAESQKERNVIAQQMMGWKIFSRPEADPRKAAAFFSKLEDDYLQLYNIQTDSTAEEIHEH